MRVLDLFCGRKGWSRAFQERGHQVWTVDIKKKFQPTIIGDVANLEPMPSFDIILASPPCETFSVASLPTHWHKKNPRTENAHAAIRLAKRTLWFIERSAPRFWVLENPAGMMKYAIGPPYCLITLCQYGAKWRKATHLWGQLPPSFPVKHCARGSPCHESAPRGHHGGGVQGVRSPDIRAEMPYGLSLAMCKAAEADLVKERPWIWA